MWRQNLNIKINGDTIDYQYHRCLGRVGGVDLRHSTKGKCFLRWGSKWTCW